MTKFPSPTRILLVDDHFFVRMGLASSLNAEPDLQVVAEAESIAGALEQHRLHRPDVTLLDGKLSDGFGIDALASIRRDQPEARIIILSIDDAEESIFRAMEAGAHGYLSKSTPRQELLHAVREVVGGRTFLPPDLAQKLQQRRARPALTLREVEVLHLVAKGTPNKLIADALGIAEITIKSHLTHIFEKLGVQDRTSAAMIALQRGLVKIE